MLRGSLTKQGLVLRRQNCPSCRRWHGNADRSVAARRTRYAARHRRRRTVHRSRHSSFDSRACRSAFYSSSSCSATRTRVADTATAAPANVHW